MTFFQARFFNSLNSHYFPSLVAKKWYATAYLAYILGAPLTLMQVKDSMPCCLSVEKLLLCMERIAGWIKIGTLLLKKECYFSL